MDPIKNPFSPGAGSPPPELVGRDPILRQADILFGRIKEKRAEKSILLTGLRGVGMTVLINEIADRAEEADCRTLRIEAAEGRSLDALLTAPLRKLLFDLDRVAGAGDKAKRAMRVLRSFMGAFKVTTHDVTVALDVSPEKGTADSGDLEADLPDLFTAIAEAAEDRRMAVALCFDEIQYLNQKELGALIMALHRLQQRRLPLALIGAGLPTLPALAGEAKSYAERLFNFVTVGPLSEADVIRALRDPARAAGVEFEDDALAEVYRRTKGYPYFVQEWGYQVWDRAESSPITLQTVQQASGEVVARLDSGFFRVRYDRLTPSEKRFLRAMAEFGPDTCRTGDVAALLGRKPTSLGPVRHKLIQKGMIYSPAYGEMAFTVPLFDQFMKRAMPELTAGSD